MNSKQLKLNDSKTECLIVGKKCDLRTLDIANLRVIENEFEVTSPIKILGIVIDCSLSFNEQINRVVKTAGYHFFFFMNGNTERAQCALSRVCIP